MDYITTVFSFILVSFVVSPYLLNIEGSMIDNIIDINSSIASNVTEKEDIESKIEPNDIEPIGINQESISELIAKDLSHKTPEQIRQYPLKDYRAEDIIEALNLLSVSDLDKTIKSISIDDLREIFVNVIKYHK